MVVPDGGAIFAILRPISYRSGVRRVSQLLDFEATVTIFIAASLTTSQSIDPSLVKRSAS
jgi:hypothetical protein